MAGSRRGSGQGLGMGNVFDQGGAAAHFKPPQHTLQRHHRTFRTPGAHQNLNGSCFLSFFIDKSLEK